MALVVIHGGQIISPSKFTNISGKWELSKIKKNRTTKMNSLLHGHIFPEASRALSEKLNRRISPEFAKALLKTKWAVEYDKQIGEYIIPTSRMNTERCCKFIEDCVRWIAVYCEYAIDLPGDWKTQITREDK